MVIENNHKFPTEFTAEQKEIIFQLIDYSTYPADMIDGNIQEMIAGDLNVPIADVAKIIDQLFKQMEEV